MGYIAHFRELNNQLILKGRNVLVVGGTGGIGIYLKKIIFILLYFLFIFILFFLIILIDI